MTEIDYFRDEQLGAALAALDVPEHRPAFFDELEARLGQIRRRRFGPLPRAGRVVVAATVAAAATVLAVAVLPRVIGGDGLARAAEVQARLAAAIAGAQTLRGELSYTAVDPRGGGGRTTIRQSFVLDASGDRRLSSPSTGTVAYGAGRGVEDGILPSASIGAGRFYAERTGLAPGPPDAGPSEALIESQLAAVTRALAAAADPRVSEIAFDGRAAWRLDADVAPNTLEPDFDHLSVTVDRATGFPLHVLTTLAGRFRSLLRVERLQIDPQLPPATFTLEFPPGAEVLRTDAGFVNVDLDGAADIVGYRPPTPRRLPSGFRLATVAAAAGSERTGPAQSNPPSRSVVSLSYRRGLEQIVVTTRRRTGGPWRDPFAVAGVPLRAKRVQLHGGAFGGTTAKVVVDPRSVPHLWVVGDRLVVTVAGDLGRAGLIEIAEAMQ
jgi:hypothetical protein